MTEKARGLADGEPIRRTGVQVTARIEGGRPPRRVTPAGPCDRA